MKRNTIYAFLAGVMLGTLVMGLSIPAIKTLEYLELEKTFNTYKHDCRCYWLWDDHDYDLLERSHDE